LGTEVQRPYPRTPNSKKQLTQKSHFGGIAIVATGTIHVAALRPPKNGENVTFGRAGNGQLEVSRFSGLIHKTLKMNENEKIRHLVLA
jgi:hypothetical protein